MLIPAYLSNGSRKIKVNALPDDTSTESYINCDVAAELGLEGQLRRIEMVLVACDIESLAG